MLRLQRFAASRTALVLGLLLANGCGTPDAAQGGLESSAQLEGDLREGSASFVPEYSQAELEALAESPEVVANNMPFANAPAPSESLYVTVSDGTRLALSL